MTTENQYKILAYLGAIPFIACAIIIWMGLMGLPFLGKTLSISTTYGLAIVSFLCGIHWGTYIYNKSKVPFNLFVTSNIITLVGWFTFVLGSPQFMIIVLVLSFLSLLFIDYKLLRSRIDREALFPDTQECDFCRVSFTTYYIGSYMIKIAIIGAGLSGLILARELSAYADVDVFEKARGVGGRMATRYADPYQFDHGAQYFTAKTAEFQSFLEPFIQNGIVAPWRTDFAKLDRG